MESQSANKTIIDGIRKNWPIIFFIGTIIVMFSNLIGRVDALTDKYNDLSNQQVQQNAEIRNREQKDNELSGAIIEIKANYLYIKEKLDKLEKNGTR
jgi:hypothetical protein